MTKAKGRVEEVDLLQIAGLDGRVWQKDGSSTDNSGIVFTLRGEVAKIKGIQPLLEWAQYRKDKRESADDDPAEEINGTISPFWNDTTGKLYPAMSIGAFNLNGAVEILVEFGGMVGVVRGNNIDVLLSGRRVATRPSEGTQFLQVGGAVLILNGVDRNMKWDGHVMSPLGILSVPGVPETPGWSSGNDVNGISWTIGAANTAPGTAIIKTNNDVSNEYKYRLTWVNNQGTESEACAPSVAVSDSNVTGAAVPGTAFWVRVTGLAQDPPQPDIIGRRLYRAGSAGINYYLLADLPGSKTDLYTDGTSITYISPVELSPAGYNLPPPVSKFAMFLRGVTFYAGSPSAPNILYYSRGDGLKEAVPQPRNAIQITTEDGSDYITAMCVASDYGLVFTRRSIHMVTMDKNNDPIVTPVSQTIGASGNRAVVNFEGRVYFFAESGVFMFDGSAPRPLSSELSTLVEDLPAAYLKDIVAFSEPKERRICFSVRVSTPDRNEASGVDEYGIPLPITPGDGSGHRRARRTGENNEVWSVHVDTGAVSKTGVSVFDAMQYKGETLVTFSRDQYGPILNPPPATAPHDTWFRLTDIGMWGCLNNVAESDPIKSFFETRWLTGKNPESDKTFYRVDIFYTQTGDYELDLAWFTDWDHDPVGVASMPMMDSSAVTWGGSVEDIRDPGDVKVRRWGDIGYGGTFEPVTGTTWDEERTRSVRVDLGSGMVKTSQPFPAEQYGDHGEGLTAKSIKLQFGCPEMTALYPRSGRLWEKWKIVGFILFYSDHGIRSDGTDADYEQPDFESYVAAIS